MIRLVQLYFHFQFVVTAEWLVFDSRKGPLINGMVPDLLTSNVIQNFGPHTPPLVTEWDCHTIYFNPAWMSRKYAAHVGETMYCRREVHVLSDLLKQVEGENNEPQIET